MKIIKAGYSIIDPDFTEQDCKGRIFRLLERAGRVCYKSENQITDETAEEFIRRLIRNHHDAMLEHAKMSVIFTVDRGISHELVRHRIASFSQESTRYCNYSKDKFGNEITVIEPVFFNGISEDIKSTVRKVMDGDPIGRSEMFENGITRIIQQYANWYSACRKAEKNYFRMLGNGATPQEARDVLPTSLKTDIVMTANFREWRHVFLLRAAGITGKPHPQMTEVMVPLLKECAEKLPALFDDISVLCKEENAYAEQERNGTSDNLAEK